MHIGIETHIKTSPVHAHTHTYTHKHKHTHGRTHARRENSTDCRPPYQWRQAVDVLSELERNYCKTTPFAAPAFPRLLSDHAAKGLAACHG